MYQNSRCKITSTSFGVYIKWIDKQTSKVIVEGHLECSGTLLKWQSRNFSSVVWPNYGADITPEFCMESRIKGQLIT